MECGGLPPLWLLITACEPDRLVESNTPKLPLGGGTAPGRPGWSGASPPSCAWGWHGRRRRYGVRRLAAALAPGFDSTRGSNRLARSSTPKLALGGGTAEGGAMECGGLPPLWLDWGDRHLSWLGTAGPVGRFRAPPANASGRKPACQLRSQSPVTGAVLEGQLRYLSLPAALPRHLQADVESVEQRVDEDGRPQPPGPLVVVAQRHPQHQHRRGRVPRR